MIRLRAIEISGLLESAKATNTFPGQALQHQVPVRPLIAVGKETTCRVC